MVHYKEDGNNPDPWYRPWTDTVSSHLLNGFSVADTAAADIPVWDFGFARVEMIGYQGQVIAAMMAGFVLVYLEKFLKKHCPEVISMIVVPFCSLVPAVILPILLWDRSDGRSGMPLQT